MCIRDSGETLSFWTLSGVVEKLYAFAKLLCPLCNDLAIANNDDALRPFGRSEGYTDVGTDAGRFARRYDQWLL